MTEPVKSTRRYNSPRRREQAAATRQEILEAAQRLFERQGYAATTMAAVAAEAGVALKTVYVVFETKSGLLRALWHMLLRGDQEDVPVGERRWYRELVEEPDPERQLRLNAHNSRVVKQRAGSLMGVIRSAATLDPDHRGAVEPHPVGLLRHPAADRRSAPRQEGASTRPRCRAWDRHPLDPQPPGPVAPPRRPARLVAGRLGAVVRRRDLLAAPGTTHAAHSPGSLIAYSSSTYAAATDLGTTIAHASSTSSRISAASIAASRTTTQL